MSEKATYFSRAEVAVLIEAYSGKKEILDSKLKSTVTNRKKTDIWKEIASKVTAVCGVSRTPDQVKRKWGKLKVDACRDISERKYPKTGGGPKAREGPFTDVIADVMGQNSCRLYGIQGGYDTGDKGIFTTGEQESTNTPVIDQQDTTPDKVPDEVTASTSTAIQSTSTAFQSTSAAIQSTAAAIQSTSAVIQSTSAPFQSTSAAIQSTSAAIQSTSAASPPRLSGFHPRRRPGRACPYARKRTATELWSDYLTEQIKVSKLKQKKISLEIQLLQESVSNIPNVSGSAD